MGEDIMKVLESERLILRNWYFSDLDDFHEISSNKQVSDLAGFRLKTSKEDSLGNLKMFVEGSDHTTWATELKALDQLVFWAVELKDTHQVIGWFELLEASCQPEPNQFKYAKEIGFVLSQAYWGHGLMPEAIKRVLSYLFDEEGIEAVVCSHYKDNMQSRKAIEKCGFTSFLEDETEIYYIVTNL